LADEIHRTIEGYGEGDSVFKEYLQNADDARSTLVHFTLDTSTYFPSKIVHEQMKDFLGSFFFSIAFFAEIICLPSMTLCPSSHPPPSCLCSGPALYILNDSVFTAEDIKNISHFGSRGKRFSPEKIGAFGIGFSTIFEITDLPSLLTGEYLYLFDPNQRYLPGISEWFTNQPIPPTHEYYSQ